MSLEKNNNDAFGIISEDETMMVKGRAISIYGYALYLANLSCGELDIKRIFVFNEKGEYRGICTNPLHIPIFFELSNQEAIDTWNNENIKCLNPSNTPHIIAQKNIKMAEKLGEILTISCKAYKKDSESFKEGYKLFHGVNNNL